MSKITDGFEHKWKVRYGKDADVGVMTYELLTHARALEAMLRKHEWNGHNEFNICPECGCFKHLDHSPECKLAKLLE